MLLRRQGDRRAGAAAGVVLVPGMGAPVMRARSGCPPPGPAAPAAPAWADGRTNAAAISAAAVTGRVLLSSALRMCLLPPSVGGLAARAASYLPCRGPRPP